MARRPARRKAKANPSPDEHLKWANSHWQKFEESLGKWERSVSEMDPDTHALLRAYRHVYAAEIAYLDAEGAPQELEILAGGTAKEAYETAREYRRRLTETIGRMLDRMAWAAGIRTYVTSMGDLIGPEMENELLR
jgi:hypothetical protein